ncbi:MAG TPA: SDR family NAD(P)-dependent oxidoreductase [Planctomycetaceae bacterium]|nr:SDR family NAD(P)-dependent oxidoreductase [Planctomycetaceae bacterium]
MSNSQNRNPLDLAGRVALVTGAGVGIGRATALALASAGATVGVHFNTSEAGAQQTLSDIIALGGRGFLLPGDLTHEEQADRAVDQLIDQAGRLDILVNNAGNPLERCSLAECPTSLWRQAFDVNVTSAFLVTRRSIPHLKRAGRGSVINNLSLSVQTGGAGGAGPYAAAKGALQVMTRTLARELAPEVRVNAVMPGVIEARHHEVFSSPERMAEYRRQTPLARNGSAEEVAQAILFLASDAASLITGAVIDINGGRFLR